MHSPGALQTSSMAFPLRVSCLPMQGSARALEARSVPKNLQLSPTTQAPYADVACRTIQKNSAVRMPLTLLIQACVP